MICDPYDHLDVLVVDDEPEVGAFVQECLARFNVRALVATSAGQARVIARVQPPSVVLLDLIKPFAPAKLLASIGTQLSKARLHGSPPPRTVGGAAQAVPSRTSACGQGPRSQ